MNTDKAKSVKGTGTGWGALEGQSPEETGASSQHPLPGSQVGHTLFPAVPCDNTCGVPSSGEAHERRRAGLSPGLILWAPLPGSAPTAELLALTAAWEGDRRKGFRHRL